jgi:hypothetical protein
MTFWDNPRIVRRLKQNAFIFFHCKYHVLTNISFFFNNFVHSELRAKVLYSFFQFQWNIKEKHAVKGTDDKLLCGLILNPEFAFNVLDRGPSADSSEVIVVFVFNVLFLVVFARIIVVFVVPLLKL